MEKFTYNELKENYKLRLNLKSIQQKKLEKPEKLLKKLKEQKRLIILQKTYIMSMTNQLVSQIFFKTTNTLSDLQKDYEYLSKLISEIYLTYKVNPKKASEKNFDYSPNFENLSDEFYSKYAESFFSSLKISFFSNPKPKFKQHNLSLTKIFESDLKLNYDLDIKGPQSALNSIFLSNSQRFLVVSSEKNQIFVWNLKRKKYENVFKSHEDIINSVIMTKDDALVISCSWDCTIRFWDTFQSNTEKFQLKYKTPVFQVEISNDQKTLFSISYDRFVSVWNLTERKLEKSIAMCRDRIFCMKTMNNDKYLIVGAEVIATWDLKNENFIESFGKITVTALCIRVSRNEEFLAILDKGNIFTWRLDTKTYTLLKKLVQSPHYFMEISEDDKKIYLSEGYKICTFDLATNTIQNEMFQYEEISKFCVISGKKNSIFYAIRKKWEIVKIYKDQRESRIFGGHIYAKNNCKITKNKKYVMSIGDDCTLRVWSLEDNSEKHVFSINSERINDAIFSPDKNFVAGAGSMIMIWNLHDRSKKFYLPFNNQSVQTIAIDKKNKYIVGIYEKTAVVFKLPKAFRY